ncbi:MAG TPA: PaaI family thioesterase [Acidimicrobiia bacterium]|nr:PaaI family thioesterase [Acidimicrobiia bacterium]
MNDGAEVLDPWSRHLGIRIREESDDGVVAEMPLAGEHMNFLDGAHGGALFSLAEAALRAAAGAGSGIPVVLDAHLALTAGGAEGDTFTATTRPLSVGRTLGVWRVTVERSDGRTVGEFTGTVRFER